MFQHSYEQMRGQLNAATLENELLRRQMTSRSQVTDKHKHNPIANNCKQAVVG